MKINPKCQTDSRQTQLDLLFKHKCQKSSYRKLFLVWDKLERSNKPKHFTQKTKKLSKNARNLLPSIIFKIEKDGVAFLNHKYISTITECARRQNLNIIKEMCDLFNIDFHKSIEFQGRRLLNVYRFVYKENGRENEKKIALSHVKKPKEQNVLATPILENNKEYRSTSNLKAEKNKFLVFKETRSEKATVKNQPELESIIVARKKYKKPYSLKEVLPLTTDKVCKEIIAESGRLDFTSNFVIQTVKKMIRKQSVNPKFYSLKGFISYMSRCLRYELHDAVKCSGDNFKFKCNIEQTRNLACSTQQITNSLLNKTLFGKIRQRLIKLYGVNGNSYDAYWFSRLDPVIDPRAKTFRIKSSSAMVADWIRNNCRQKLNIAVMEFGLTLID